MSNIYLFIYQYTLLLVLNSYRFFNSKYKCIISPFDFTFFFTEFAIRFFEKQILEGIMKPKFFKHAPSIYETTYLSLSLVFPRVLVFNPPGTEASVFIQESLLAAVVDPELFTFSSSSPCTAVQLKGLKVRILFWRKLYTVGRKKNSFQLFGVHKC